MRGSHVASDGAQSQLECCHRSGDEVRIKIVLVKGVRKGVRKCVRRGPRKGVRELSRKGV